MLKQQVGGKAFSVQIKYLGIFGIFGKLKPLNHFEIISFIYSII